MFEQISNILDHLACNWLDRRQQQTIDELPEEFQQDFKLHKAQMADHKFDIMASHPGVAVLADEAAALLNEANAEKLCPVRHDAANRPRQETDPRYGTVGQGQITGDESERDGETSRGNFGGLGRTGRPGGCGERWRLFYRFIYRTAGAGDLGKIL
ncbi:MAG: hypothetical protein DRP56_04835 [Planctomycetota bacterium]|nr:MAG: hypothetical protein DRP56_04835 [Planctomycetota bacterium]